MSSYEHNKIVHTSKLKNFNIKREYGSMIKGYGSINFNCKKVPKQDEVPILTVVM